MLHNPTYQTAMIFAKEANHSQHATLFRIWKTLPRMASKFRAKRANSLPRIGESLATERQAIRPAPQPPATVWDLSVPTISSDKGSDNPPTPPPVEISNKVD